jgi:hypothetical protein
MNYGSRGRRTSNVEVTNVSRHGFWLLVGSRELFAPFDEFPWFRDATIGELTDVELQGRELLRWPQLDVDLAVESLEHPERFPLVSRMPVVREVEAAGAAAVRERPPKYKAAKRVVGVPRARRKTR